MGAPKQKWTHEEEAALRNGVEKYGPGKWRAILRDPTWSSCLASRSNVDLKDKWRNMSVTANGWGSREKARLALKRSKSIAKQSGRQLALSALNNGNMDVVLVTKPLTTVNPYLPSSNKRCISRLDKLILDAVSTLKEPNGSSKSAIATYIELALLSDASIDFEKFINCDKFIDLDKLSDFDQFINFDKY